MQRFQKFWAKFKTKKKGYWSLLIMMFVILVSCFVSFFANDKPIMIKYKNHYYFPLAKQHFRDEFVGDLPMKADYKDEEVANEIEQHGWMLWPPLKYNQRTLAKDVPYYPYPPNWNHILGVDDHGRDVLALIIYGLRISLAFGFILTFLKLSIGLIVGITQGFFGGWIDVIIQRITEIVQATPSLLILIILSTFYKQSFWTLVITLSLIDWTRFSNIVRLECIHLRKSGFVLSAKSLGISNFRIITLQIVPNLMFTVLTHFPFSISGSISLLVSFDFLGIGLPYGSASLGEVLNQARNNLHQPSIAIVSIGITAAMLLMFFFIADALRETSKIEVN